MLYYVISYHTVYYIIPYVILFSNPGLTAFSNFAERNPRLAPLLRRLGLKRPAPAPSPSA